MLKIDGKTFMNIQEAVQWLLENNALPFQSTANYIGNTEIGMGTIVNPSPAKVRIGSLIFFADSKVSTVTGLTENGFICSNEYNDLVDDIAYVTNVAINASGHLITTLSDGQTIDAGIVKQVSDFRINASQHLEVFYNDGTSEDLGAIFSGNVTISGTLDATTVTGDTVVEKMVGYSFTKEDASYWTNIYSGIVKTGNKITMAIFGSVVQDGTLTGNLGIGYFSIPSGVGSKLYPYNIGSDPDVLAQMEVLFQDDSAVSTFKKLNVIVDKVYGNTGIGFVIKSLQDLDVSGTYYFRIEVTFLLSENLAS